MKKYIQERLIFDTNVRSMKELMDERLRKSCKAKLKNLIVGLPPEVVHWIGEFSSHEYMVCIECHRTIGVRDQLNENGDIVTYAEMKENVDFSDHCLTCRK